MNCGYHFQTAGWYTSTNTLDGVLQTNRLFLIRDALVHAGIYKYSVKIINIFTKTCEKYAII